MVSTGRHRQAGGTCLGLLWPYSEARRAGEEGLGGFMQTLTPQVLRSPTSAALPRESPVCTMSPLPWPEIDQKANSSAVG